MLRKRFEVDEDEGHYYTSRDLMDLQLEKDNVPGYLIAWDTLCLEVDLAANEKEICFFRQIEKSGQVEVVFREYMVDCTRKKAKYKSYEVLRKRVDTHLGIAQKMKARKALQPQTSGHGLAAVGPRPRSLQSVEIPWCMCEEDS